MIFSCLSPHGRSSNPTHRIVFKSSSNWARSNPPSRMLGVTFLSDTCAALCRGTISLTGITDYSWKGGFGNSYSLGSQFSNLLFSHSVAQECKMHKCGESALGPVIYSLELAPFRTSAPFSARLSIPGPFPNSCPFSSSGSSPSSGFRFLPSTWIRSKIPSGS